MLVGSSSMCVLLKAWFNAVGNRRPTVEQPFRDSMGPDRHRVIRDNLVHCTINKNGLAR